MGEQPTIKTRNLTLRPFNLSDATDVQRLAGDKDIASTTLNIPHPYEDGMAEQWISTHKDIFEKGKGVIFAIVDNQDRLIGTIGLCFELAHERAELGYWIGKPYWNKGYCTEAAQAIIKYGFEELGFNRINASHITRNPASGIVMQKIGMKHEGTLREHIKKWGLFEDIEDYAILKREYFQMKENLR
jgi:[ribosomal protein S5]-alanine N-acetyltransferase